MIAIIYCEYPQCRTCTMTCNRCVDSGGTTYNDPWGAAYELRRVYDQLQAYELPRMVFSAKEQFWMWLRSLYPLPLHAVETVKDMCLSRKRYFRRLLFCKSGYLPGRIRKIRCSE